MLSRPDLGKLGEELHSLLVGGDETAPSRIAETFLPVILTCLRYDCRAAVDDHLIMTAAHDALLGYLAHPQRFDPKRASLITYLRLSARGDLLNALKQRSIEDDRNIHADVEKCLLAPEEHMDVDLELDFWTALANARSERARIVAELVTDPTDRKLTELMVEGVRATAEFAGALGIDGLHEEEQRRIVKQHKDRIKAAIHRRIRSQEGGNA
jgi:RNA polymerase sigma-70 factor, ECF subfamily